MTLAVAGVVLAAGASTRMGRPKALLSAGQNTFVGRLVQTLGRSGCSPVVVVVPAYRGALAREVARGPAHLVVNPGGAGGQIGSLRTALTHLRGLVCPPAAIVFTPVDNPAITAATVAALIAAWRSSDRGHGTSHPVVLPVCGGRHGHPVLVDMCLAHEFYRTGLQEGARAVTRGDPSRVLEVPVDDAGITDDLDTPEQYRARFCPAATGKDRS